MSILVLGTVALDTVKTPHGIRKDMLGGSATHFAMAARLFTEVHLVACIGDNFPQRHVEFLRRNGIITDSLVRQKGKTFRWSGDYCRDLNCAMTKKTEIGVIGDYLPTINERERHIKYVFLANYDPDIQKYLLDKLDRPRFVGLDSMNLWINIKLKSLKGLLKRVDIFVANEQEAKVLSQEDNLLKCAKALRSLGPDFILIKKGEHGSILHCKDFTFCMPAFPIEEVRDPTGAGDSFAGGFMGYLSKVDKINQKTLKMAVVYGSIVASFNVQQFGCSETKCLTLEKLNNRLKIFKKYISIN